MNDVLPLLACLPRLQHLILSSNPSGSDPVRSFSHPSLQTIDLSSNGISSWSCIAELAAISTLRNLYLNDNPIAASAPARRFPSVLSLHIASAGVESLQQLVAITGSFPALQELEIRGNRWYDQTVAAREVAPCRAYQ